MEYKLVEWYDEIVRKDVSDPLIKVSCKVLQFFLAVLKGDRCLYYPV